MTDPLISCIIPTYNRPKIIKEAIQSILTQTYQNYEILIIDDCSNTDYYLELPKIDSRIQIFRTKENSGPAIARNLGLDLAKGKYISFLDDDDLFLPHHLSTGIQFLEKNPDYHGIYFNSQTIKKGKLERIYGFSWKEINKLNPLRNHAMIFRQSKIRFGDDKLFKEDYRFWKKFEQQKLKIMYKPIITSHYRKDYSERDKLTLEELNENK